MLSVIAITLGASCGALVRWGANLLLNAVFPLVPLGTLVVNLTGGYLVGVALSLFAHYPSIPMEWRLFLMTGFLGALTTFSAFSAEVVTLLRNGEYFWGMATIALHVGGSLIATFLGIATFAILRS